MEESPSEVGDVGAENSYILKLRLYGSSRKSSALFLSIKFLLIDSTFLAYFRRLDEAFSDCFGRIVKRI